MKIESLEELFKRVNKTLKSAADADDYEQSREILAGFLNGDDKGFFFLEDAEMQLVEALMDADGEHPMHEAVKDLVLDILADCIERGNAAAMCDMGALYYTGRAGEQDYRQAAYYYDMADKAGNRQATENLGYIYYYGRIGERDYEKAFKYFVKGALDGHLRSLYKIGDFYRYGNYVERDPKEAFIIYQHCLVTMTDEAIPEVGADIYLRMGDCLYEGIGVEQDLLQALHFLSMAETLFYKRLMEGDFYQQKNLEHVLRTEEKIRKEIKETKLPDLSWAGYEG